MKQTRIFVTGTDTEVGKTYVSCLMVQALQRQGIRVVGLKPIASGCKDTAQGLRNSDALALQRVNQADYAYDKINPIAFKPAIAPHIAAEHVGERLSVTRLQSEISRDFAEELVIIEGAGGWLLPLNERETMADFVVAERLPVILVVAMRLGCLNHALLTVEAIRSCGVSLLGWVANTLTPEPMTCFAENLACLHAKIKAPCLAVLPFSNSLGTCTKSL